MKECDSYVFNKDVFKSTLTEEWNMVCKGVKYQSLVQSFYFAGYFVGSLFLGILSDMFGRRKVMGFCCVTMFTSQVVFTFTPGKSRPFASTFGISVLSRFLMGCAIRGLAVTGYVLVMEIVSTNKRSLAGIFSQYSFAVGQLILLFIAYFVRNWRTLCWIIAIILFPFCFLYFILPESPRWLMQKKKYDKTEKMLRKIAEVNKRDFDPEMFHKMIESHEDKSKANIDGNIYSQLKKYVKSWIFMTILSVLIFSWFVQNFIYYGISLSTGSWGHNEHLNFFLSAISDAFGGFLTQLLLLKFGKISSYCFVSICSGLSSFALIILRKYVVNHRDIIVKVFATLSKLFISSSYITLYMFSSELFPTPVRNSCMGLCSAISRLATILSVHVSVATSHNIANAFVIYAILSILAGLTALVLPETKHENLPEDVSDLKLALKSKCFEKSKVDDTNVGLKTVVANI